MSLSTPTLTVSDNADGSGGVATLSTSDPAATNTVYYATYFGIQNTLVWYSAGARIGDGTVTVAPVQGNNQYFWYALSTLAGDSAASNVVFQSLTDAAHQSVHYRCLVALKTRLVGLNMDGIGPDQIILKWQTPVYEVGDEALFPLLYYSPHGREGQPGVLNVQDDIEYPIQLVVVDRMSALPPDVGTEMARNLLWREKIFRALRHQRLVGVQEIFLARVAPDWVVDEAKLKKGIFWAELTYYPTSRERRGV
jgi:hypothetical protein